MDIETRYEWGDGVYTLLSWFKKDRVKNARVLVAGAGALGNEVVKNLALFGVGTIIVVDFDRIEISNLTRSVLFRENDAFSHRYKAEVVAERAMEINPQIKVIPIVGNLFSDVGLGVYRSVDVIIGCLDSRIARYQLNRLAFRAGKNWIDGSIENLTGVTRVYAPGVSCYECGLSREEFNHIMLRTGCADVVRTQGKAGRIATTPVSASIIGALQVQEAMKIIHMDENIPFKTLQGKILRYDGMTNSLSIFKQQSWKPSCTSHEIWESVVSCPRLSSSTVLRDALEIIKETLDVNQVEINLRNNKFIISVISDNPEKEFNLCIPESRLEETINRSDEMRKLSHRTLFHKVFVENIDSAFQHKDLSLEQIGIPAFDVIEVTTEKGLFHVELTGDSKIFIA